MAMREDMAVGHTLNGAKMREELADAVARSTAEDTFCRFASGPSDLERDILGTKCADGGSRRRIS